MGSCFCVLCFFSPWWVAVSCSTFSVPHLGVACPPSPSLALCPFPLLLILMCPSIALSTVWISLAPYLGGWWRHGARGSHNSGDSGVLGGRVLGKRAASRLKGSGREQLMPLTADCWREPQFNPDSHLHLIIASLSCLHLSTASCTPQLPISEQCRSLPGFGRRAE